MITISSVWPEDPLFIAARARNIRIVEIDAARALSPQPNTVALVDQPGNETNWRKTPPGRGNSPFTWFSPSNGIRMAEIIAPDLVRLSPQDAARIATGAFAGGSALRASVAGTMALLTIIIILGRWIAYTPSF